MKDNELRGWFCFVTFWLTLIFATISEGFTTKVVLYILAIVMIFLAIILMGGEAELPTKES
ncbi:MAG: hypothetical protein QHH17_03410 [Candidatus Bathyarchaeota archaeon]|jgi:hypothetical protein|nr:hypothetical protein [Candidatus Bathyarchaeota archaeon]